MEVNNTLTGHRYQVDRPYQGNLDGTQCVPKVTNSGFPHTFDTVFTWKAWNSRSTVVALQ